jgi:hypothetical protein
MKRRGALHSGLCLALSVVLVVVSFAGCAGTTTGGGSVLDRPGEAAVICGAAGAVTGAAIGGAASQDWRGALIGGLAGGALAGSACFAIAEYRSRAVKGYAETRETVNYRPAQGDVVEVSHYAITPGAVSPGNQASFQASYYVMTPNPDEEVTVTETRIVKMYDQAAGGYKELGRAASQVTVKPGTRQADGKWDIRSGVAEAQYLVVFEVAKSERSAARELPLIVTRDQAVLQAPSNRIAEVSAPGGKAADSPAPAASRPSAAPPANPAQPSGGVALASLGEPQPQAPPIVATTPPPPPMAVGADVGHFLASKVTGRGNVREGPGATHRIVGEVRRDERFPILDRSAGQGGGSPWYKIRLDTGLEGWVAGSLGEEVRK